MEAQGCSESASPPDLDRPDSPPESPGNSSARECKNDHAPVLSRLPRLLAMEALLLVVISYPLRLSDAWRNPLLDRWHAAPESSAWARFGLDQIEAFISFAYSPLIFKGVLAAMCAMALFGVLLAGAALRPLGLSIGLWRAAEFRNGEDRSSPAAYLSWLLFLVWAGASVLWSPTRLLSLEGIPWLVSLGALGFVLLRRGITQNEVRQLGVLFVLLGTIVGMISVMQALPFFQDAVFHFLHRFEDPRNIYGSLIGHNTAVGSFMLMTAFPAVALIFSSRSRAVRLLLGCYLALALLTMLIVQSRSVWILASVLGVAFVATTWRQEAIRWKRTLLVVSVLAVASQVVQTPWNPLAVRYSPMARKVAGRLGELTPERLKDEARLRLLVVSIPLVQAKPIFGWGLYAFQFAYPKAHADYFALHPDSKLGLTTRRSHMAHNEYLQVWIEHGLVGLLLMGVALGEVAWRGRRITSRLEAAPKLIHTAFGFSALALALDALVNFPFHVPQLAVPWFFCLACYGSLRTARGEQTSPKPPVRPGAASAGAIRSSRVARLAIAGVLLFSVPLTTYPFVRLLQADVAFNFGSGYLDFVRQSGNRLPPPTRDEHLRLSIENLQRAIRLQASHDQARAQLGIAYFTRGNWESRAAPEASIPNRADSANRAASAKSSPRALASFRTAVEYLNQSMTSLQYHFTYYLLARCYGAMIGLVREETTRASYRRAYQDYLELAVYYSPSFVDAVHLLAEWLAGQPRFDPRRVMALRRSIKKFDTAFFHLNYELNVNRLMQDREFREAVKAAENLFQIDPLEPGYIEVAMDAHMLVAVEDRLAGDPADHHGRVLDLARLFRDLPLETGPEQSGGSEAARLSPFYDSMAGVYEATIMRQWPRVLDQLTHHSALVPRLRARFAALEAYAREKTGRRGMPTRFPRPRGPDSAPEVSPDRWRQLLAEEKAMVLYRWLGEIEAARRAFEERIGRPGPAPSLDFWVDCASLAHGIADGDLLRSCLNEIRERRPDHPVLSRLEVSPVALAESANLAAAD